MKLSARGGRLKGKGFVLIAAAASVGMPNGGHLSCLRRPQAAAYARSVRRQQLLPLDCVKPMNFKIELDQEDDGRWIAEVPDLPGVMTYGTSRDDAIAHVQALALRVLADRLEQSEAAPDLLSVTFKAA